jgi:hypothetical protein
LAIAVDYNRAIANPRDAGTERLLGFVLKRPAEPGAVDEAAGLGATTSSIVLKYGEEERRRPAASDTSMARAEF